MDSSLSGFCNCILSEPGAEAYNEAPKESVARSEEWVNYLDSLCPCVQTHSVNVAEVKGKGERHEDTDALICSIPGIPIGVRTADCVPIVFYAPDIRAIGVAHAGWKGTIGGIVRKVVERLKEKGAKVDRLKVSFGASISSANYEVSHELAEQFAGAGLENCISYPHGAAARPHLDLQEANVIQMVRQGVKVGNILRCQDCTFATMQTTPEGEAYCYRSYRRDPENTGRNVTWIKLTEGYIYPLRGDLQIAKHRINL